ncbi:hypothetical protein PAXRUDRAFT_163448, partial [Paxillus rubicundulus Ve08.2h10]
EHFEHPSYHTSRGDILTIYNDVHTIQQGVQPYGSFQLGDAPGTRYEARGFFNDGSSTGYPYNVNEGCNVDSASKETASPWEVPKHKQYASVSHLSHLLDFGSAHRPPGLTIFDVDSALLRLS